MRIILSVFIILLTYLPVSDSRGEDPSVVAQAQRLIDNGGFIRQKNGINPFAVNQDKLFVPASILKIATSLAALDILGESYHFQTYFFLSPNHDLYIQGKGDPFLVSEEIALIAASLRQKGVTSVMDIVIDQSFFGTVTSAHGAAGSLNPYDVPNAALAVNFNTIMIAKNSNGTISSAEKQTPTLPIMKELGIKLPTGEHRINVSAMKDNGDRYAAELFAVLLQEAGIDVSGKPKSGTVPQELEPLYVHVQTKSLREIISPMLSYSSNFIANQLFLACGGKRFGYPVSWEKGARTLSEFLEKKTGLSAGQFNVVEGSGLSRSNRISPKAMLKVLDAFKPYADLMPVDRGVAVKSGTLSGVYSYAGYFRNGSDLEGFVIMLNQQRNTRDRLMALLGTL